MHINSLKAMIKLAVRGAAVLLLGVGAAGAQQTINLSAGPASASLPDGSSVPMWGYSCGAVVSGSTASCASLNPTVTTGIWSPVVIKVPTGQALTINLTNNLSFAAGTGTNTVPTSLMIVGQVGGGLGDPAQRTTTASPNHNAVPQGVTWPTANTGANFTAPTQPNRVQSFGTEVAAGATTALAWTSLRPGTYLIESGTHPSVQATMGLYGILVVTAAPTGTGTTATAGTAYPTANPPVTYSSEVPLALGEIDPVQNNAVNAAVHTVGFSETMVWSGQPGGCGNASSTTYHQCYPPTVNYTPLYYTINGVAFSRSSANASLFASSLGTATTPVSGNVLVRLVNAGSRMHVPSIVGSQTSYQGSLSAPPPASNGFTLIAEDGNPLPPTAPRVQSEVFMAAGKTFDVMINVPATGSTALPVYDRELSLSANKINRDAGMLAYIGVNGAALPAAAGIGAPVARADSYNGLLKGQPFTVSDPSRGVIANDTNVYGVTILTQATNGVVTLNADGTFTYTPNTGSTATSDSFTYEANGNAAVSATVTLGAATIEGAGGITVPNSSFTSKLATFIRIPNPGILSGAKDAAGYPLKVVTSNITASTNMTVVADPAGGFIASVPSAGTYSFTFQAQNAQGTLSSAATATVVFPTGSGLTVNLVDGKTGVAASGGDYRWIIEEDRSFYVNPNCTQNYGTTTPPAACAGGVLPSGTVPLLGTNFHTSDMPFVAQGCTGPLSCEAGQMSLGSPVVCDVGDGVCRPDTTTSGKTAVLPGAVALDPTKRYYISVLPGDAANPFISGNGSATCGTYITSQGASASTCGYSMGGAPIAPAQTAVTVQVEQDPFPPSKLSVDVFEDDFPLNGEQDSGGGVDVLSPQEPGLGGFSILLWDDMGGSGDVTGQMTYDMFNQPLSNSLDGTIDPVTGMNACPITKAGTAAGLNAPGITGMIVTCPKYESDGVTLSPLAGQAVVANLMPGRFSVQAIPGADRIAKGENWLQTNTLDGQKAHDSFLRIGEPAYFQEFGPAGYHVNIGFANPKIIQSRLAGVCAGSDVNVTAGTNHPQPCNYTVTGKITDERMSRTPDERLYSSGSHDAFSFTQCYISVGDPDGEDFAFTYCNADGTFKITGLPAGDWRLTTFDEWNDMIVDGLSTPLGLTLNSKGVLSCPGPTSSATMCDMGDLPTNQWQANVYTRTFIDDNHDGISQPAETGIPFLNVAVRYRDGSLANNLGTDFSGVANFNETFPLFNWYVVETDTTRYKTTGIHTVYDAGGPADNTLTTCYSATTARAGGTAPAPGAGYPACGTSAIASNMANTVDANPLPANLSVPGAVYCPTADCTNLSIQNGAIPSTGVAATSSTGRIDPPWVPAEGWQGYSGQSNFIEFGKAPYIPGENGGIHGHVVYASTRPFDDPMMLVQTQWEPLVPHVTINLYQEGLAADGVTKTLNLVDTTQTSSFDDWAQGFRSDGVPNMNCPGQTTSDLFYFSLLNQPQYLDWYNKQHATPGVINTSATPTGLPSGSQFKCYDGMHNWNQLQPTPYDGMYSFPSVLGRDPHTGNTTGTNCTMCVKDPDAADAFRFGKEDMLPAGKYVVEVVPPDGYEIVKEEDKNILIGDNFIAPVTQQFGGLGDIFIIPDQASVAGYNANNAQNPTQSLGTSPNNGIVPGFTPEPTWPCVGDARIVPDYISLFPQSQQVAPFAGATRNLCDRKEVTLNDQAGAIAKFYLYTSTHKAAKFTGVITDDFTSEFDPFSPQFGEKFAPPNMPISVKDWTGTEIGRVYSDWWGDYDGMTYSTWEVNPPNPTGYSPTMMIFCMNDKGTGATTDPLFNPAYSQFCYELPYMPGQTQYLDTPVVPTSAFSAGYNHPDCNYPDATPSISSVISSDIAGPWVSAAGTTHTLTINSLPDQQVTNYAYAGPNAKTAPFNQKTINRHFGFGATAGTVTIGGVTAPVTSWSDAKITVSVPSGIPNCAIQQQAQYGGSTAQCGQLLITSAGGQQSIDTVTVTVGGKKPTVLAGNAPGTVSGPGSLQQAIDAAMPGDMIIVPPGTYKELLVMWKPIRLQGVGAASSVIDANAQPAGKLDPWRRQVACDFGIAINGRPISATNPFDNPTDTANNGGPYTCSPSQSFSVDRLPLEATVGWDATLNGNLAEMLQEPTLMGAYEGAGITVLGKGVHFPTGSNPFGSDTYPTGTVLLDGSSNSTHGCGSNTSTSKNPNPSNFNCNPSSIDAMGITDASQGGGGIFVHGFNHNIQIANNRVYANIGTLSGGINIGQGEFPPQYLQNGTSNADPGSCVQNLATNEEQPYCFNLHVNVHHNQVTNNTSIGDELFSGTLAGAGGVSFCTGSDYYKFSYNWICGNMSSGDGGGVAHLGFSFNGDIEHNSILFNQSLNPTIPTNGGGLMIEGTPDTDPVCGLAADADCPPGFSDGVGPNLIINANLIQGNAAEAGTGGGIRFQSVNGTEVTNFPTNPKRWYSPLVTNNIIVNNVAGWDGGGVSFEDALYVLFMNNTVMSNDSTATAGVLFNTLGAPLASSQTPGKPTASGNSSLPQPAGLVTMQNSVPLTTALAGVTLTCPSPNPNCQVYSNPYLANNIFWQNRSYYVGVSATASTTYQQNIVTLYNAFGTTTPANQTVTGACDSSASYWDIGVRGDTGPGPSGSSNVNGLTLALSPVYSLLTNPSEAGATATNHNLAGAAANPAVKSQYCNGSRVPPEFAAGTYNVPPGIADATVPNPLFTLQPTATVDEGNNWVNMVWGPLSLTNPSTAGTDGNFGGGAVLGNYSPASVASPAVDHTPSSAGFPYVGAPSTDFFGNLRKTDNFVDAGAVEFQGAATAISSITGGPLVFGNVVVGSTSATQTLTLHNTGAGSLTGINVVVTAPFARAGGTCTATLAPGTCTITVSFTPTATGAVTGTVTVTGSAAVTGSPVVLGGTGVAAVKSATLTPTFRAFGNATRGVGVFTAPTQVFTLTNTGNVPLTGIGQGTLSGTNATEFTIVRLLSSCGPAGGGQLLGDTTLAPGATCAVTVQFRPLTTQTTGAKTASLSVADVAGTQTATPLTGTAQ